MGVHYIQIGEHEYELPKQPPKSEIFFHDEPKAEQYWRRQTDFPKFFFDWYHPRKEGSKMQAVELDAPHTVYDNGVLISLSKEDSNTLDLLQKREVKRMTEGVWFMNNGDPTYLTGRHYGVLQWTPFKGSLDEVNNSIYGMYMQLQRDFCYFLEIIKKTPKARGGNVGKPKKTGITQLMACWILVDSMLTRTGLYRIMSTKEDIAKESCMAYAKYALERVPAILTPTIGKENMGEITFGKPDGTKGNKNKRVDSSIEHLETTMCTVPTAVQSFDTLKNDVAWIDEQSKIIEVSPQKIHDVTIATVMVGMKRHGFIIYTHYVAEHNNKSFMEAREIWFNSKLRTIVDGAIQTKSKLLCFPLTVWDGIQGGIDKYGKADKEAIKKFLDSEIASKKGNEAAMQAFKRQYPRSEQDMWELGAGEKSIFDNVRLGMKMSKLNEDASVGVYPYFEFNFRATEQWTIDEAKQVYKFPGKIAIDRVTDADKMHGKKGLFRWYREEWTPPDFISQYANNLGTHKKNQKPCPRSDNPFYMAMDPTGMAGKKEVVTGSNNAIQVFMLPNAELDGLIGQKVTNKRLMVSYLHRADNPMDTLKHAIQAIMYFGCYLLLECNQMWVYNRLIQYGFENFLMVLNADGVLEPYKAFNPDQKPFTSQAGTIDSYVNNGLVHYGEPEVKLDIDNIDYLDDEKTIEDLILFDPTDTKKFDSGVCNLIGQYGMSQYLGWREGQRRKTGIGEGTMRQIMGFIQ